MKKVLILELNEFNKYLLKEAAEQFNLKNIQKMISLRESKTVTDDTYDSNFLEPWVQWVSVHAGIPSSQHQIKHLGDVPGLGQPQIWEKLSEKGVTCGIWGVMNGDRRASKNVLFFLPDPWTFSESGFPHALAELLDFPRYLSRNYLKISYSTALKKLATFLKVMVFSGSIFKVLRELPSFIFNNIRYGGKHFISIFFADLLLTDLFFRYKKKYNPDFTILFLNGVAHLQHHHWHGKDHSKNPNIKLGMQYLDRILGLIFKNLEKNEILLCMNGLSQKNTDDEDPWVLYRQISHFDFLKNIGIKGKAEPLMTYDAHIFFETAAEKLRAQTILENTEVNGRRYFLVETYADEPLKLFYRINFSEPLPADAQIQIDGKAHRFYDLFEKVVQRTGKHIPNGSIYVQNAGGFQLPESLYNHELYSHLLKHYDLINQGV